MYLLSYMYTYRQKREVYEMTGIKGKKLYGYMDFAQLWDLLERKGHNKQWNPFQYRTKTCKQW